MAGHNWNMRYALNLGLNSLDTPLFRHHVGGTDPLAHIALAAQLGFAGVEDNFLKLRPPEEQSRIGAALARNGLEMGCFVNNLESWNTSVWTLNDSDSQSQLARELDESIEVAKRVGGRNLTTMSGRDPQMPISIQRSRMIENLKRLAPVAERAGVVIAIEAVSPWDFPGLLLTDVRDAHEIVTAVGSPAVRLVFDVFHVQATGGNVIRTLTQCWESVGVIQVADNPRRTEMGSGELNWANVLGTIRQLGYRGLIELEHEIAGDGLAGEQQALARLRAIDCAISVST